MKIGEVFIGIAPKAIISEKSNKNPIIKNELNEGNKFLRCGTSTRNPRKFTEAFNFAALNGIAHNLKETQKTGNRSVLLTPVLARWDNIKDESDIKKMIAITKEKALEIEEQFLGTPEGDVSFMQPKEIKDVEENIYYIYQEENEYRITYRNYNDEKETVVTKKFDPFKVQGFNNLYNEGETIPRDSSNEQHVALLKSVAKQTNGTRREKLLKISPKFVLWSDYLFKPEAQALINAFDALYLRQSTDWGQKSDKLPEEAKKRAHGIVEGSYKNDKKLCQEILNTLGKFHVSVPDKSNKENKKATVKFSFGENAENILTGWIIAFSKAMNGDRIEHVDKVKESSEGNLDGDQLRAIGDATDCYLLEEHALEILFPKVDLLSYINHPIPAAMAFVYKYFIGDVRWVTFKMNKVKSPKNVIINNANKYNGSSGNQKNAEINEPNHNLEKKDCSLIASKDKGNGADKDKDKDKDNNDNGADKNEDNNVNFTVSKMSKIFESKNKKADKIFSECKSDTFFEKIPKKKQKTVVNLLNNYLEQEQERIKKEQECIKKEQECIKKEQECIKKEIELLKNLRENESFKLQISLQQALNEKDESSPIAMGYGQNRVPTYGLKLSEYGLELSEYGLELSEYGLELFDDKNSCDYPNYENNYPDEYIFDVSDKPSKGYFRFFKDGHYTTDKERIVNVTETTRLTITGND